MEIKCTYTELKDIASIVVNPRNPNKHSDQQIDLLAKILKYQGQRSPLVISKRSSFLVAGHGRLEAMKKLGIEKCAVDLQDFASEADEYAHMIADNEIARLAEADLSMIHDIAVELPDGFDFDLLGIPNFNFNSEPEIQDKDLSDKPLNQHECPNCQFKW
jgi:ParB-like nuclease domain